MSTDVTQELAGLQAVPDRERCQALNPVDPASMIPVTDLLLHVRPCPNRATCLVEGTCEAAGHLISRPDCGQHDPGGLCGYCADTGNVSRVRMMPVQDGGGHGG